MRSITSFTGRLFSAVLPPVGISFSRVNHQNIAWHEFPLEGFEDVQLFAEAPYKGLPLKNDVSVEFVAEEGGLRAVPDGMGLPPPIGWGFPYYWYKHTFSQVPAWFSDVEGAQHIDSGRTS